VIQKGEISQREMNRDSAKSADLMAAQASVPFDVCLMTLVTKVQMVLKTENTIKKLKTKKV
jgi:hypothetical protein